MLKMIHGRQEERLPADKEMIYIKDAAWPVPFKAGLEYNSPCHGPWNIVHIGMAVPGSHQIYVCGANCNRGVVLTAAEMKASHRYSTLALFEEDLTGADMESLVIDGVTEIIEKLPEKPPLVFVFTVCVHRFMGLDLSYIYSVLRERFSDIIFVESAMEPISQKGGLTPEQRLRDGMHSFLTARRSGRGDQNQNCNEPGKKQISIIGGDFPIEEGSEIKLMMREAGILIRESSSCQSFEEYLSMGDSSLFLCCYPTAVYGVEKLAKRLGKPWLYLPDSFSYDEIRQQIKRLEGQLQSLTGKKCTVDHETLVLECEQALEETRNLIGETGIAIDASAVPRYLGLARLLLTHGFHVIRLYGDVFSPEEKEDYHWLIRHAPDLTICPTIHPGMRVFPRGQEEKVLAIGQKAAYFHQTPYFVNIVQGAGLHGYDGIKKLAKMMREAFLAKKDTRDLVGRKGLGCETY